MTNLDHLIAVGRYKFNPDWTISKIYLDGLKDGYAVEDEIREKKVYGETAIPYGVYRLGLRMSPNFSKYFLYSDTFNILIDAKDKPLKIYNHIKDFREHELIWIENVPEFEYVLLHWGNTDDDTKGCLIVGGAVGIVKGQEGVMGSRAYYKKIYPKLYKKIKAGGQTINYFKDTI